MAKIEVNGIYKIFGPRPQRWLDAAREGISREELLARSGHTLGLRDITLSVEEGSIYVIMGLSGSGKSTLIRHFNRLIEPTAGHIRVDDVDVMSLNARELERFRQRKMSMVFQRFGLFPHRCVLDNAAYGLKVQGVGRKERQQRAMHWLEQVGLAGYERQYPHQLSGGMQQRVGVVRALANHPDVLLMDEPFASVDAQTRMTLQEELTRIWQERQTTVLFITHDVAEAVFLANRVIVLSQGHVKTEIEVPLPHPRRWDALMEDERFKALSSQVLQQVRSA